jgi:hypothetical protein
MSGDEENELDERLSRHFADTLDPVRGRAIRAIEAEVAARHRWRRVLIGASSLIAASIALAIMTPALWRPRGPVMPIGPVIDAGPLAASRTSPRDIEQLVAWEASDEGVETVQLADQRVPVRKVRQEALEEVKWFDPQRNATMRLTVPRQQVFLIEEDTY